MKYAFAVACLMFVIAASPDTEVEDQEAIRMVFTEHFATHWRNADAAGLAALWQEDGDWMNLVGSRRIVTGHDAIGGVWAVGLRGRDTPESLALVVEIDHVAMISPECAMVDLVMTYGHERTGIVREAMTAIVTREGEAWRITHARVARISTQPARGD